MNHQTFTDPVCGMAVDPAHAVGSSLFEGTTHHFCAMVCKRKFDADPSRYAPMAVKESSSSSCCRG